VGDAFLTRFGERPVVQPVLSISSIVNAASYAGGAVVPGEMLIISGANLGPANVVAVEDGARLPLVLSDVRVLFDGNPAPLLSVSATRIAAVAPFGIAGTEASRITVEYRGERSPELSLPVVVSKPGLFSSDGSGRGQAVTFDTEGAAVDSVVPGSIVTVIGTGAGLHEPPANDGEIATDSWPPLAQPVRVTLGDVEVNELFFSGGIKGRVAGVFQVQFRVPEGTPAGTLAVQVTVGTESTQAGLTITVLDPESTQETNLKR
jgi:uncharacterized protein (TIGR03437 family)